MEDMIVQFSSLGAVGIVAAVLFKKFIEDSNSDKEYFRKELKESREIYQAELKADRETYTNSIEKITNKIAVIEDDVKEIKDRLEK